MKRAAWVLALALALSGCGMYGPLYLIEDEGQAAPETAPAQPAEPAGAVVEPGTLPAGDTEAEEEEDEEDDEESSNPGRDEGPEGES